ncbi:MAG: IPT/TIG domain-containing protein, partial [Stackebrandtia sp.]
MTFRVYPDPPTDQLALAAGATSAPVPIVEELFGSSAGRTTMFIRYVLVGTDCAPPPSPAPTVFLVTDGSEREITSVNNVDPTPVAAGRAFATVIPEGRAVFRLEVTKNTPARITWQIRFRNNHAAAAQLTWVVADAEAETRQPWIEAPHEAVWPTMPSGIQPGQAVPLTVQVANKGTASLVISDAPGRLENSDFTLSTVPPPIPPNACGNLEFEFTPPASPGRRTVSYIATSNDSTALAGPPEASHNKRLDLVAEVGIPAPAFNASPPQFSPEKGVPGTRVTLNGRNFDVGTPEVRFGTVAAVSVGVPTPAGVTAVVPAGLPPGGVQITVVTGGGTAVSDDRFTVLG